MSYGFYAPLNHYNYLDSLIVACAGRPCRGMPSHPGDAVPLAAAIGNVGLRYDYVALLVRRARQHMQVGKRPREEGLSTLRADAVAHRRRPRRFLSPPPPPSGLVEQASSSSCEEEGD